jgi:hypothetical protein
MAKVKNYYPSQKFSVEMGAYISGAPYSTPENKKITTYSFVNRNYLALGLWLQ